MHPPSPKPNPTKEQTAEFLNLLLSNTLTYGDPTSKVYLTNMVIFSNNQLSTAMKALESASLITTAWTTPSINTEF
jgi:hypothetical protein